MTEFNFNLIMKNTKNCINKNAKGKETENVHVQMSYQNITNTRM